MYGRYPQPEPSALGMDREQSPSGEITEYWWQPQLTDEGVWRMVPTVVKTDRFGQRWILDLDRAGFVTYRVAAKMLDVSVPAIYQWEGHHFQPYEHGGVKLMTVQDLFRIAYQRGIIPTAEG